MDSSTLMWGMLFGCIGLGFFRYGKQQQKLVPYFSGVALMIYPYFVESTLALVAIGVGLCALPYFIRY